MADDPGALSNLRDLALPDPVAWWPPAVGVWIVAATVIGFVAVALARAAARHRADAYRRAAVSALDGIEERLSGRNGAREGVALAIFELLKRTALAGYPRDAIASLAGPSFVEFLAGTTARPLDVAALRRSAAHAYDREAVDAASLRALVGQARIWIASHRAPIEGDG